MTKQLLIEFERIGRTHTVPPLRIASNRGDDYIVRAVQKFAGKYLRSHSFEVSLTLPYEDGDGEVWIDGGRFGNGTVKFEDVTT